MNILRFQYLHNISPYFFQTFIFNLSNKIIFSNHGSMRKRCKQSIPSATPLQITSPFPFLNHNSKQSQTDKIDREKAFNQFWVLQNSYPNPPSAWTCRLHFWLVLSLPWCILKPFNLAPERCYRNSRSRLRLRIQEFFQQCS